MPTIVTTVVREAILLLQLILGVGGVGRGEGGSRGRNSRTQPMRCVSRCKKACAGLCVFVVPGCYSSFLDCRDAVDGGVVCSQRDLLVLALRGYHTYAVSQRHLHGAE